jgi:hypothetical protein
LTSLTTSTLALLLTLLCGCRKMPPGHSQTTHHMEMYLRSASGAQFAGAAVGEDLAAAVLNGRQYDLRLIRILGGLDALGLSPQESAPSYLRDLPTGVYAPISAVGQGPLNMGQDVMTFVHTLDLHELAGFEADTATLELSFPRLETQAQIDALARSAYAERQLLTSAETVTASGIVTGVRAGEAFEVTFTQELRVLRWDDVSY